MVGEFLYLSPALARVAADRYCLKMKMAKGAPYPHQIIPETKSHGETG